MAANTEVLDSFYAFQDSTNGLLRNFQQFFTNHLDLATLFLSILLVLLNQAVLSTVTLSSSPTKNMRSQQLPFR